MKKLLVACILTVGSLGLYSCNGNDGMTDTDNVEGTVIDTDTTVSELEVERTVREVDTTIETETETIETDQNQ